MVVQKTSPSFSNHSISRERFSSYFPLPGYQEEVTPLTQLCAQIPYWRDVQAASLSSLTLAAAHRFHLLLPSFIYSVVAP